MAQDTQLHFLYNLLRIFPYLKWPSLSLSLPDGLLPDLSLPDSSFPTWTCRSLSLTA